MEGNARVGWYGSHRSGDAGNAQRLSDRVTGDRERDVVQERIVSPARGQGVRVQPRHQLPCRARHPDQETVGLVHRIHPGLADVSADEGKRVNVHGREIQPAGSGEPFEGAQSGEPHLMARGDEAGAKGRGRPHIPLGTDCQYCNSHFGCRLSALLHCPQGSTEHLDTATKD